MQWKWSDGDIVTGIVRTGGFAKRAVMPYSLLIGDVRGWVERRIAERTVRALRCDQCGDKAGVEDEYRVIRCLARWERCYELDDGVAYAMAQAEPLLAVRMHLGIDGVCPEFVDEYVDAVWQESGALAAECGLVPADELRFLLVYQDDVAGLWVSKHLVCVNGCRAGLPVHLVSEAELADRIAAWS